MPLYSGSAQACERHKIFDNKQLAGEAGIWHLVIGIWQNVATLCLLGLGLGGAWATQAWPKGHASTTQAWIWVSVLFATEMEKRPGRGRGIAVIADIARDRRDRKS
jgi:hypothetical protein